MGCSFNFTQLHALTRDKAVVEAQSVIEDACHEYGHGGYTGTFAEALGCEVAGHPHLESLEDAELWLYEHARKWGPALLVVTATGRYCMGANCSS